MLLLFFTYQPVGCQEQGIQNNWVHYNQLLYDSSDKKNKAVHQHHTQETNTNIPKHKHARHLCAPLMYTYAHRYIYQSKINISNIYFKKLNQAVLIDFIKSNQES